MGGRGDRYLVGQVITVFPAFLENGRKTPPDHLAVEVLE